MPEERGLSMYVKIHVVLGGGCFWDSMVIAGTLDEVSAMVTETLKTPEHGVLVFHRGLKNQLVIPAGGVRVVEIMEVSVTEFARYRSDYGIDRGDEDDYAVEMRMTCWNPVSGSAS